MGSILRGYGTYTGFDTGFFWLGGGKRVEVPAYPQPEKITH